MKYYIGIVGPIGSGKGVMSTYLMQRFGFTSFSLSSIVHAELEKRKIKTYTRQTLQDIGDDLRKKFGSDYLAQKSIEILDHNGIKKVLIDGIRNPAEVTYLQTLPHFILVGVTAKREIRYKRILKREKPWDPKNWQEFLEVDKRDSGLLQSSSGQQVGKSVKMANYILSNNTSLEYFYKKIDLMVKKIMKENSSIKSIFKNN